MTAQACSTPSHQSFLLGWSRSGCPARAICVPTSAPNQGFCSCEFSTSVLLDSLQLDSNVCQPSPLTTVFGVVWALFAIAGVFFAWRMALVLVQTAAVVRQHGKSKDILFITGVLCVLTCLSFTVLATAIAIEHFAFINDPHQANALLYRVQVVEIFSAGVTAALLNIALLFFGSSMVFVFYQSSRFVGLQHHRQTSVCYAIVIVLTLVIFSSAIVIPFWFGQTAILSFILALFWGLVWFVFRRLRVYLFDAVPTIRSPDRYTQIISLVRGVAQPLIRVCNVLLFISMTNGCVRIAGSALTNKTLLGPVSASLDALLSASSLHGISIIVQQVCIRLKARVVTRRVSTDVSFSAEAMRQIRAHHHQMRDQHHHQLTDTGKTRQSMDSLIVDDINTAMSQPVAPLTSTRDLQVEQHLDTINHVINHIRRDSSDSTSDSDSVPDSDPPQQQQLGGDSRRRSRYAFPIKISSRSSSQLLPRTATGSSISQSNSAPLPRLILATARSRTQSSVKYPPTSLPALSALRSHSHKDSDAATTRSSQPSSPLPPPPSRITTPPTQGELSHSPFQIPLSPKIVVRRSPIKGSSRIQFHIIDSPLSSSSSSSAEVIPHTTTPPPPPMSPAMPSARWGPAPQASTSGFQIQPLRNHETRSDGVDDATVLETGTYNFTHKHDFDDAVSSSPTTHTHHVAPSSKSTTTATATAATRRNFYQLTLGIPNSRLSHQHQLSLIQQQQQQQQQDHHHQQQHHHHHHQQRSVVVPDPPSNSQNSPIPPTLLRSLTFSHILRTISPLSSSLGSVNETLPCSNQPHT